MSGRLTLAAARRIGLAAQGFGRPRPATVTMRHVQAEIDRVAQFQIDSVNVAVRAHYMPLFARLGAYDTALLDRASGRHPRRVFEYWGHAACLIDTALAPALAWRQQAYAERGNASVARILAAKPEFADRILADVAASGPLTSRDIQNAEERSRDHWGWNWSEAKYVLEHHFNTGTLAVADRNTQFERRYDLPSRVLPGIPALDRAEAHEELVRRAARALGVADLTALSEYFYLKKDAVRAAIARLTAAGELEPVTVVGLPQQHWLWHEARRPRTLHARALVSPFDSLVFERRRLEGLFGAHYRIEIYTPAAQRRYGYYVNLFVLDDAIAARVDLKADRSVGVLLVQAAWLEPDQDAVRTARALADELYLMAGWLGLGGVRVVGPGTLAPDLARSL